MTENRTGTGLAEAVGGFLEHLRNFRRSAPATVAGYEVDLRVFSRWLFSKHGALPSPREITRPEVIEFLTFVGQSCTANTIRRKFSALSSFYNYCLIMEICERDPTTGVPLPRKSSPVASALTQIEVRAMIMTARKPWDRCALILLTQTGLRRAELVALRVTDVDLQTATVRVAHGKGDKPRTVPLSIAGVRAAREYLALRRALPKVDTFLVTDRGEAVKPDTLYDALKRIAVRAGLDPHRIHPHAFRHTFATIIGRETGNIRVVQELLGHSDLNTTARYVEVDSDAKRKAVELLHA